MNLYKLVLSFCCAALLGPFGGPAAAARLASGETGAQPSADSGARGATWSGGATAAGMQRGGEEEFRAGLPAAAESLDRSDAGQERAWIGGLASGLGLSALLARLGVGAGVADWTVAGLALVLLGALGWGLWRAARRFLPGGGAPLAFQDGPQTKPRSGGRSSFAASGYEPASLAPESSVHYGPSGGIDEVASRTGEFRWGVPKGFDAAGFLQSAKRNFVLLQEAWDRADLEALRALMTDDMLGHIRLQLAERGDQPNRTDVVTLQAELLGVEDVGTTFLASVEFSGMIREEITSGAAPFREVWNLTKPRDGSSGWLLAGVQALQ
ncbi:membrane protein [Caldimonas brevitalea]|uniref:Membrane protein n=2 Tax=Caldimonas brevitalea TaxID=413882 RepID=A0A0G3BMY7_9BURK|nr:membrane protein [Caldimonas brevitalea]